MPKYGACIILTCIVAIECKYAEKMGKVVLCLFVAVKWLHSLASPDQCAVAAFCSVLS